MISYCLDKDSLEQFLRYQFSNCEKDISDENLASIIDGAINWTNEVSLIVYFFSTYLQRRMNKGEFVFDEIASFYNSIECGNFKIQEFDREFIKYIFDHSRPRMNMTLEEVIVKIQEDLSDKNYGSNFRY